jgi:hypothetical protein
VGRWTGVRTTCGCGIVRLPTTVTPLMAWSSLTKLTNCRRRNTDWLDSCVHRRVMRKIAIGVSMATAPGKHCSSRIGRPARHARYRLLCTCKTRSVLVALARVGGAVFGANEVNHGRLFIHRAWADAAYSTMADGAHLAVNCPVTNDRHESGLHHGCEAGSGAPRNRNLIRAPAPAHCSLDFPL